MIPIILDVFLNDCEGSFLKAKEIIIDDKEKLKGEQNPPLTYQDFRSDLVTWNGVQDVIQESDILSAC